MPVEGLPDPALHRLCRRCGTWYHLHEGSTDWPPVTGLISFIQVRSGQLLERTERMQFRCRGCFDEQARKSKSGRRSLLIGLIMLALIVATCWWLGVFDELEKMLRQGMQQQRPRR